LPTTALSSGVQGSNFGSAAQAQRAQLYVVADDARADELGQRAARRAAQHVDLEQPVLGRDPALQEQGVALGMRVDVGHPVDVAQDPGRPLEARQRDRVVFPLAGRVVAGMGRAGDEERAGGQQCCEFHGVSPV
jgi:hypothetical protein